MNVTVIHGKDLTTDLMDTWRDIQAADLTLSSPYFHPEFTKAVASVCNDVWVGVLREGSEVVGFFPFQKNWLGVGQPIGSLLLSDFHGVILKPGVHLDAKTLIRQCGLRIWDFDHLPANQTAFLPFHRHTAPSSFMDISLGYETYCATRRKAGSEQIKKTGGLRRKLEREAGPLRFLPHTQERIVLETLLKWKRAQYRETGYMDIFAFQWINGLLNTLLQRQTPEFGGILSALYVKDEIVAAHFGMRCGPVWHYWFPAYNPKFSKYSPGLILLLQMAEHGAAQGFQRIDLGKGEEPYKQRLRSGTVTLLEGCIERSSPALVARRMFLGFKGTVEGTKLDWPLRMSLRRLRRLKSRLLKE